MKQHDGMPLVEDKNVKGKISDDREDVINGKKKNKRVADTVVEMVNEYTYEKTFRKV